MIFFNDLSQKDRKRIFFMEPSEITKATPKEYLSFALGATLYIPAIKEGITGIILDNKYKRLTSIVLCLEDSIPEDKVQEAEENIVKTLTEVNKALESKKYKEEELPLIFIRVRNIEQFDKFLEKKQIFGSITGFCFPKFNSDNGQEYMDILSKFNEEREFKLYAMPIIETKGVAYKETRIEELIRVKQIIDQSKDMVLNVRIGGTDLLGLYSIRRQMENSIYDIGVIRDCISDIINIFGRAEEEYIISGPVWEYFDGNPGNRILKPQLREKTFFEHLGQGGLKKREYYLQRCIDGLIKEVVLDKANGLIGKTIIHPTHISIVNALYVVTKEEYEDASAILEQEIRGASKSRYNNKMNEENPHNNWAKKVLKRAYVYGVFNEELNCVDLF